MPMAADPSPSPSNPQPPRPTLAAAARDVTRYHWSGLVFLAWLSLELTLVALLIGWLIPPEWGHRHFALGAAAFVAFMFRTFLLHIAFAVAVVGVFGFLVRRRRLGWAGVGLAALILLPHSYYWLPHSWRGGGLSPSVTPVKVLSCNLLWGNMDDQSILALIDAEKPDLLLFQEYSNRWDNVLYRLLSDRYPHRETSRDEGPGGMAIFSRLPFIQQPEQLAGRWYFAQQRGVIAVGEGADKREVEVFNIHLKPPGTFHSIADQYAEAVMLEGMVREAAARGRGVVVAGDFNATQYSRTLGLMRGAGLTNVQAASGWGPGTTWPAAAWQAYLPGVRIDHGFVGGGLSCAGARAGPNVGSDHRPIVFEFGAVKR